MDDMELLERLSARSVFVTEAYEDFHIWITRLEEASTCDESEFSAEQFEKPSKPTKKVMSKLLYSVYKETKIFVREAVKMKEDVEELKSSLIRSQNSVIKLQSELLEGKSKQLESVQTTVKSAVQETVQAEIRSYSKAVSKDPPETALTEQGLKKAVQSAVSKEDRSKNFVVFGLMETDDEKLSDKVDELFEQIEVKPRYEAVRIGRRSADKTRPIKISVTNSNNVHEILLKSKNLRRSQHHKTVYISPDRSPEEQARQHLLVLEMKEKAKKDLKRRYYIRSGIICCEEKISE